MEAQECDPALALRRAREIRMPRVLLFLLRSYSLFRIVSSGQSDLGLLRQIPPLNPNAEKKPAGCSPRAGDLSLRISIL
jgi:hypothetical protein